MKSVLPLLSVFADPTARGMNRQQNCGGDFQQLDPTFTQQTATTMNKRPATTTRGTSRRRHMLAAVGCLLLSWCSGVAGRLSASAGATNLAKLTEALQNNDKEQVRRSLSTAEDKMQIMVALAQSKAREKERDDRQRKRNKDATDTETDAEPESSTGLEEEIFGVVTGWLEYGMDPNSSIDVLVLQILNMVMAPVDNEVMAAAICAGGWSPPMQCANFEDMLMGIIELLTFSQCPGESPGMDKFFILYAICSETVLSEGLQIYDAPFCPTQHQDGASMTGPIYDIVNEKTEIVEHNQYGWAADFNQTCGLGVVIHSSGTQNLVDRKRTIPTVTVRNARGGMVYQDYLRNTTLDDFPLLEYGIRSALIVECNEDEITLVMATIGKPGQLIRYKINHSSGKIVDSVSIGMKSQSIRTMVQLEAPNQCLIVYAPLNDLEEDFLDVDIPPFLQVFNWCDPGVPARRNLRGLGGNDIFAHSIEEDGNVEASPILEDTNGDVSSRPILEDENDQVKEVKQKKNKDEEVEGDMQDGHVGTSPVLEENDAEINVDGRPSSEERKKKKARSTKDDETFNDTKEQEALEQTKEQKALQKAREKEAKQKQKELEALEKAREKEAKERQKQQEAIQKAKQKEAKEKKKAEEAEEKEAAKQLKEQLELEKKEKENRKKALKSEIKTEFKEWEQQSEEKLKVDKLEGYSVWDFDCSITKCWVCLVFGIKDGFKAIGMDIVPKLYWFDAAELAGPSVLVTTEIDPEFTVDSSAYSIETIDEDRAMVCTLSGFAYQAQGTAQSVGLNRKLTEDALYRSQQDSPVGVQAPGSSRRPDDQGGDVASQIDLSAEPGLDDQQLQPRVNSDGEELLPRVNLDGEVDEDIDGDVDGGFDPAELEARRKKQEPPDAPEGGILADYLDIRLSSLEIGDLQQCKVCSASEGKCRDVEISGQKITSSYIWTLEKCGDYLFAGTLDNAGLFAKILTSHLFGGYGTNLLQTPSLTAWMSSLMVTLLLGDGITPNDFGYDLYYVSLEEFDIMKDDPLHVPKMVAATTNGFRGVGSVAAYSDPLWPVNMGFSPLSRMEDGVRTLTCHSDGMGNDKLMVATAVYSPNQSSSTWELDVSGCGVTPYNVPGPSLRFDATLAYDPLFASIPINQGEDAVDPSRTDIWVQDVDAGTPEWVQDLQSRLGG